jgi:hypothetical protein
MLYYTNKAAKKYFLFDMSKNIEHHDYLLLFYIKSEEYVGTSCRFNGMSEYGILMENIVSLVGTSVLCIWRSHSKNMRCANSTDFRESMETIEGRGVGLRDSADQSG